jgi:hypothetical protein
MSPISDRDADNIGKKARPKGTLPYLPDGADAEALREWLTRAFHPPAGWQVQGFERMGRGKTDAALLRVANGRESKTFRFDAQRELMTTPRTVVAAVANGWLNMPHLTAGEIEDVWMALCTLGQVLSEHDDIQEAREWVELLVQATLPLSGHTLVPDGRHDALMAIKAAGEFTKGDALALLRTNEDQRYQQRPTRFVDSQTGDQWVRVGETATYVRWVIGVEPLSGKMLRARLHEVGVVGRLFEDYRPPHPKLQLYQLPEGLIGGAE